jgi:phosphatidylserine decarboxylase
MRICPESLPFILPPALAAAAAFAVDVPVFGAVLLGLVVVLAAFFRDPPRHTDAPDGHALAPADGRVVEVVPAEPPGRGPRIAIFLSLLDVHVARAPLDARIVRSRSVPGGYRAAFRPEATRNARTLLDMAVTSGQMHLALIAGLVARRVVPWVGAPMSVRRGQRIAVIRFGSRAEVDLPRGYRAGVEVGQRVRAGETVIAMPACDRPDASRGA